jgi:hypothetical protein
MQNSRDITICVERESIIKNDIQQVTYRISVSKTKHYSPNAKEINKLFSNYIDDYLANGKYIIESFQTNLASGIIKSHTRFQVEYVNFFVESKRNLPDNYLSKLKDSKKRAEAKLLNDDLKQFCNVAFNKMITKIILMNPKQPRVKLQRADLTLMNNDSPYNDELSGPPELNGPYEKCEPIITESVKDLTEVNINPACNEVPELVGPYEKCEPIITAVNIPKRPRVKLKRENLTEVNIEPACKKLCK